MKHFERIDGLQCNLEKTLVSPIGGNYDIDDKQCPELALSWENEWELWKMFQQDAWDQHEVG